MSSKFMPHAVSIAVMAIVGIFAWISSGTNVAASHIKLSSGKSSMDIGVTKGEVAFNDILKTLLSGDEKAQEMQALLENAIEHLDYNHPMSRSLRKLQDDAKGPFQDHSFDVKVSFTSNAQLHEGFAAVCRGSDFYNRRVMIFNKDQQNAIPVIASQTLLLCESAQRPHAVNVRPIIQIHISDARKLFGEVSATRFEDGVAQIVPAFPIPVEPEARLTSIQVPRQL